MADPILTVPGGPPGKTIDVDEAGLDTEFHRGIGVFDATMIVAGSMIGSGIFIVSAEMSRQLGSPGWLLVAWLITGVLTIFGALCYGELAAMMPRVGGQYVFLREAFSPLMGFLYSWTFLLVIQAGSIAAVAVAFARFGGVLIPGLSENSYLIEPFHISQGYALSLSTAQAVALLMIAVLTVTNMCGLEYGKIIQNLFTVAKTAALILLIVLGITIGWNADAVARNFGDFWTRNPTPDGAIVPGLTAATTYGLFIALCVSQTGSLFSADSWHNVAMIAGEVRRPQRTLPLALALGAGLVITLYVLANVAYLVALPLHAIQTAPLDRVGTLVMERIFGSWGGYIMAAAIMISTFGCNNGLILAGARTSYALARDGLFFGPAGRLNAAKVPAWGLALQGIWAGVLVLPRVYKGLDASGRPEYGNLYSNLLAYVISAALLFYILTILGLFRLRRTRPNVDRPYKAFGYPVVPALYIIGAAAILGVLVVYQPELTWPGLAIVALGVPFYFALKGQAAQAKTS
jgi:APA family basic amino acid/polyamine antiporter